MSYILPKIKGGLKDIKEVFLSFFQMPSFLKKLFFVWAVYFTVYFPLIRSFMIFAADNDRVIGNTHPWIPGGGRYLNDWLIPLVFASPDTQDIQPLPRLLALLILALATFMFVHIVCRRTDYFRLFLGTMIGLCPFYAQNISYSMDAPYMCASILFAVIPFLFWEKGKGLFCAVSVMTAFFWLGFYQSAIGCYLLLLIYLSFRDFLENKKTIGQILILMILGTLCVFVCSMIADKVLSYFLGHQGSYTANHLRLCSGPKQCFDTTLNSLNKLIDLLRNNFKDTHFAYIFIGSWIMFVVHVLYKAIKVKCRFEKFDNFLIGIFVCLGLFSTLFIYQALLINPQFDERTIINLGMLISLCYLDLSMMSNKVARRSINACAVGVIWCFAVFIASYGNLWAYQMRYSDYIISQIKKVTSKYTDVSVRYPHNGFHIPLIENQNRTFRNMINSHLSNKEEKRAPLYQGMKNCADKTRKYSHPLYQTKVLSFTKINDECVQAEYVFPSR